MVRRPRGAPTPRPPNTPPGFPFHSHQGTYENSSPRKYPARILLTRPSTQQLLIFFNTQLRTRPQSHIQNLVSTHARKKIAESSFNARAHKKLIARRTIV